MAEVIAGRFELIEHIAQGGSGSVWLARDIQRSMRCAAKVMRQSYSGEILRFVREQAVKFDHPHLLTPYGWAAVDDQVVIASQLMRGGNLHTAMQDYGAFSPELTAEILIQLLDGLDHVHAAGWVHRDVKPANVLLELTGTGVPHVRLTDFGIATHRHAPRLTELGMTVGTEGYLAPQQRAGREPEPAQDLYALGVLGMQLLDPALRGDELRERSQAQAGDGLLVPPPLGPVLGGLLSTDPRQREQAASEAEQRLRRLRNPHGYTVASGEVFEVFDHFAENGESCSEQQSGAESAAQPVPPAITPAAAPPAAPPAAPAPDREADPGSAAAPAPRRAAAAPWLPWLILALAVLLGTLALWLVFGNAVQPGSTGTSPDPAAPTQFMPGQSSSEEAVDRGKASAPAAATGRGEDTSPAAADVTEDAVLDVGISSTAREGEDCTVLEAGLIVEGADGLVLRCQPDGAAYRWVVVD